MAHLDEDLLRKHRDLILAATGDGVYGLDCDGITTFANPAASLLTGYSPEEIIGKGSHDLIHHSHEDGSEFPRVECPIYAAFKDGKVHRVSDEVFWRKDGSCFPVEYVSTPIFDDGVLVGAVVSFRDITERRRNDEALRESEERYRKIFDATHDAIFLVRVDNGAILDVNEEACRMLGYSHETLTAMTNIELHPQETEALKKFLVEVCDRGKWETDKMSCLASDGQYIPVRLSANIFQLGGHDCILVLAMDMREYIKSERKTRELQADLHHVSRLSAMGEMASGMAHELNQPLTAVMNYVQASRRILEAGSEEMRDKVSGYLEKTAIQAERAGKIIASLRKFIKKEEAERSWEDINEIVEEASNLVLSDGSAEDIELELKLSAKLPLVFVDKIQIQQVVFNLVRNGGEALAEAGGGRLAVITSVTENASIMTEVCNNGLGVDDEILGSLFDPFVTTKRDGMGVGLSICRSIVEEHGGRIEADRNDGGGLTVQFTLPILKEENCVHG